MSDFEEEVLADAKENSPLGRNGSFVARSMLEFKSRADGRAWGYNDGMLAHWTAADVEEFLLEHTPRKLSQPGDEADDNADCVIAMLEFLDEAGVLEGDTVVTLTRTAESLRSAAARAARDPSRWGPAKALFMQAASEGLDVQDPAALETWMESFNSRPVQERDRILGPSPESVAGVPPKRSGSGGQGGRRSKRKAERAARRRNRR